MNNSNLIIYTFKDPLYCCCFIHDSLMACASENALIIWDFASGKLITHFSFVAKISPIAVSVIQEKNNSIGLLLQLKQTKVLILSYDKAAKSLKQCSEYQLQMIGFTKLSIFTYVYSENQEVTKQINSDFFTINNKNIIQKRSIWSGDIKQQFEIDQTTLQDVCYVITYQIQNATYFLVVEQGAHFKLFLMPSESSTIEVHKRMQMQSKEQIKIVLSIEPTKSYKAYVCLRNSSLYIMNLKELQVTQTLNITAYRLVKTIRNHQQGEMYIASSKNQISVLKDNKLKCTEKIGKFFILDIDTFGYGAIGVTQQGKIFLLPLL